MSNLASFHTARSNWTELNGWRMLCQFKIAILDDEEYRGCKYRNAITVGRDIQAFDDVRICFATTAREIQVGEAFIAVNHDWEMCLVGQYGGVGCLC